MVFLGGRKKHSLKKIVSALACAFFKSVFFVDWLDLLTSFFICQSGYTFVFFVCNQ